MVIRGSKWAPIEIPIRLEGALNYLGGIYDLEYSRSATKTKLIKITRASCAAIKATNGWQNYIDTLPENEHRCWAGSLVDQIMESGLYVMHLGEPVPTLEEPVHRFLQLTGSESKEL